ncbi:MAG: hypothetical protein QM656_05005 [Paracoccaceae bacterium]
MTALRSALNRFIAFLDVMDAAVSASAAVRLHQSPAARDLRRLGIDTNSPAIASMGRF